MSAQPLWEGQQSAAAQSIGRAKAKPTIANVVDAISELHTEVTADIKGLKKDVGGLKTDVGKLLDHFGIVSGGPP